MDVGKLTPELRKQLLAEYGELIDKADLTPDEVELLVHILTWAGCSEDGLFFLPAYAILWGEVPSYIPPSPLPVERTRAALRFLLRRGILREIETLPTLEEETQRVASVVDKTALQALAAKKP